VVCRLYESDIIAIMRWHHDENQYRFIGRAVLVELKTEDEPTYNFCKSLGWSMVHMAYMLLHADAETLQVLTC
jgi:hypothetical protein